MQHGYFLCAIGTNGTSVVEGIWIIDTIYGATEAQQLAIKDFESKGNTFENWQIMHCMAYDRMEEILGMLGENKFLDKEGIETRLEKMGIFDYFEYDCHILNTLMEYGLIVHEPLERYRITEKGKLVNNLIKRGGSFATENSNVH